MLDIVSMMGEEVYPPLAAPEATRVGVGGKTVRLDSNARKGAIASLVLTEQEIFFILDYRIASI
jgi:hypothetical protein